MKNRTVKKDVTEKKMAPLFHKENYKLMLLGIIIIALGMILMSGGKNDDPSVFDYSKVYSFTRITLAPILILLGLVLEIFAIFRNPSEKKN